VDYKPIFLKALSFWPETIDVSERQIFDNGGAKYLSLVDVHDSVEEHISNESNTELLEMDWAIFTVLYRCAKYQNCIYPHSLNFESVLDVFFKNKRKP